MADCNTLRHALSACSEDHIASVLFVIASAPLLLLQNDFCLAKVLRFPYIGFYEAKIKIHRD
jgi:hypothetical protein